MVNKEDFKIGLDKFESKFDSDHIFAARSVYDISEYVLVESITQAFIAHARYIYLGFHCGSGMRYILRYIEEGFRQYLNSIVVKSFIPFLVWHPSDIHEDME